MEEFERNMKQYIEAVFMLVLKRDRRGQAHGHRD